jgi:mono/diheme cytochrome c family protein
MKKGILVLCLLGLLSCYRGKPSDAPPVHLIRDMDTQPKYKAQSSSPFFPDGAAMRSPVPGTVPVGADESDTRYYRGQEADGRPVQQAPVNMTLTTLQRGRERFNIYCSPCHSKLGDGHGIMVKRGYVPPPSFHDDRLRQMADGTIFNIITNGIRNMPSYRHQIPVQDRWYIVQYVRALQRSQNATLTDVPENLRTSIK